MQLKDLSKLDNILTADTFQFQKVQLKGRNGQSQYRHSIPFQFQKVQLKASY